MIHCSFYVVTDKCDIEISRRWCKCPKRTKDYKRVEKLGRSVLVDGWGWRLIEE